MPALGQVDPVVRDAARNLAREGIAAYRGGDMVTALEKLQKAYALVQEPSVAYWSARLLEETGTLAAAAERYRAATRLHDPEGNQAVQEESREAAQEAYDRLIAILPRLAVLVEGAPADEVVFSIDDRPMLSALVGEAQLTDIGEHIVKGVWGDQQITQVAVLEERERGQVTLVFEPKMLVSEDPLDGTGEGSTRSTRPGHGDTQRGIAWVSVGVGLAGFATFAVSGAMAASEDSKLNDACPGDVCLEDQHDDLRSFQTVRAVSSTGFVVGVLGVATGITLLVLRPKEPQSTVVQVSPTGLSFRGQF
jgi:hypothetical protein